MPFTATFTFETFDELSAFLNKPVTKETPAKPAKAAKEPEAEKVPAFMGKKKTEAKAEEKGVTYEDVKAATNELIRPGVAEAGGGRAGILKILATFGVEKATELSEEQWAPYIAACKKVVANAAESLA